MTPLQSQSVQHTAAASTSCHVLHGGKRVVYDEFITQGYKLLSQQKHSLIPKSPPVDDGAHWALHADPARRRAGAARQKQNLHKGKNKTPRTDTAVHQPESISRYTRTVTPDSDGGLLVEEGSLMCRLLLPAPPAPCRLGVREPEADLAEAASSNKRPCSDGICFFIAVRRFNTEGEGAPIVPLPAAAATPARSSFRAGEKAAEEEDTEVDDLTEEEEAGKKDCLEGVVVVVVVVVFGDDDGADSNRLPRVDLSDDAIFEVADAASFAFSLSCGDFVIIA